MPAITYTVPTALTVSGILTSSGAVVANSSLTVAGLVTVNNSIRITGTQNTIGIASQSANFPLRINQGNTNAQVNLELTNEDSGTSASASLQLVSNAGTSTLRHHSILHSVWPNTLLLGSSDSIAINTGAASDPITFYIGGSQRAQITNTSFVATTVFDFAVSANSTQAFSLQNTSTGTSAATRLTFVAGASSGSIQLYGSGNTTPDILQFASPTSHRWLCNGVSKLTLTTDTLSVLATTASTSTSTGALVVPGGLGVAGAIYAGGQMNAQSSSSADSGSSILGVLTTSGTGVSNSFGGDFRVYVNNSAGVTTNAIAVRALSRISNASTVTNAMAIQAQVDNPGGGTIGTAYGLFVSSLTVGSSNYAIYTSGSAATYLGGKVGIGNDFNTSVGLYLRNSDMTGTQQYGIYSLPTFSSASTTWGRSIAATVSTAAASFTMTDAAAFYAWSPNLGAGSSITSTYGMYILNQGGTGITNSYGLYIAAQSGSATVNYAIYTNGGNIRFGSLPTSSAGLAAGTLWNDTGTLKIA